MDLGKKESQVAAITEAGELIEKRIRTERGRLIECFKTRPKAKILVEASMISEWVARVLEELGHEVVVADPNYAPMYAQRSRRVKTDKRDAQALAEACRLGAYRPAHRTSDAQRHVRVMLTVRESLIRSWARLVTLTQALLSAQGVVVPTGSSGCFGDRVEGVAVPDVIAAEIAPLLTMLSPLNAQIEQLDEKISELARKDDRVKQVMTMSEIGPVTAVAFVACLDDLRRFRGPHEVEAYLGLVPREWSSSEVQKRGHITKAGHSRVRWLLVEAAWRVATHKKNPETLPLRGWTDRIARRRGQRIAVVALARKLAGILYAIVRDGAVFDPKKLGKTTVTAERAA